ncbi:MAG: hypothetical protein NTV94_16085, partial [Planctomycetota bacterium]|nr:hypothetical protein [Planctomycetota bacterium]
PGNANYSGKISADAKTITGRYMQGAINIEMDLKKDEPKAIDPKPATQPQGTVPTIPVTRPGIGTEAPPITPGRFLPEGTFVTARKG